MRSSARLHSTSSSKKNVWRCRIPNNDKQYSLQLINLPLHFLLCNLKHFKQTISAFWNYSGRCWHYITECTSHNSSAQQTRQTGDSILTCRPLPFEVWRLQRPRLPLGVVPQLLMICSCFSARSARSSSSSMNCCSRTLAFASRAAVSCRNWSIWATSLWAERGGKISFGYSLKSGAYFIIFILFYVFVKPIKGLKLTRAA